MRLAALSASRRGTCPPFTAINFRRAIRAALFYALAWFIPPTFAYLICFINWFPPRPRTRTLSSEGSIGYVSGVWESLSLSRFTRSRTLQRKIAFIRMRHSKKTVLHDKSNCWLKKMTSCYENTDENSYTILRFLL